ncbi:hypothetical protein HDE_04450 [Halotydeus destructor]|nr:hypothetical protein HDE_04450 [Halotydeus destructor]
MAEPPKLDPAGGGTGGSGGIGGSSGIGGGPQVPPPVYHQVSAVKVPPFMKLDPSTWFRLLEAQFAINHPPITVPLTKYYHAIGGLPEDISYMMRDFINDPPTIGDIFVKFRDELIKRNSDSHTARLKQLLETEQLGDRKPSQLLRVLKEKAEGSGMPSTIMKELFLQRLPVQMQGTLAIISEPDLMKLADIADTLMVYNPQSISAVASQVAATSSDSLLERLVKQVEELSVKINRLESGRNSHGRPRGRSESRNKDSKNRSRSKSSYNPDGGFCWYHFTYGEKATKCQDGCSFKAKSKN